MSTQHLESTHDEEQGTRPGREGRGRPWRADLVAGFFVFLIALPLCLGIAGASGFPPIAGVFTAVIGGITGYLLSNSNLTIKGPAAGLIAIALGCLQDFGGDGMVGGWTAADQSAYRLTLGILVVAAGLQIGMGIWRMGVLGELFPAAVVHGMLAAIGMIIIAKQVPVVLGIEAHGEPLELLMAIPSELAQMNPEIALIGGLSLIILFAFPWLKRGVLARVPAPLVVVLITVPVGVWFQLDHTHTYPFAGTTYEIREEQHLVNVPPNLLEAIVVPDFSGLLQAKAWKWVVLFAVIGSLESVLSAKAVDGLDPQRRQTNQNRDLMAIGVGNLMSASIGGLPMISEIVRSKANIDSGGQTRLANLSHGLFLLLFVATVPWLLHRIPMAALAAMLVYTGCRLASPREFAHAYHVGREQFAVFVVTLIAVLATDLLVGVLIGMAVKLGIHFLNGLSLRSLLRPSLQVEYPDDRSATIVVKESAVFSNWLALRRTIEGCADREQVTVELAEARLVDHTVMDKLATLSSEYQRQRRVLQIRGLDGHDAVSPHPRAARRRGFRAQEPFGG